VQSGCWPRFRPSPAPSHTPGRGGYHPGRAQAPLAAGEDRSQCRRLPRGKASPGEATPDHTLLPHHPTPPPAVDQDPLHASRIRNTILTTNETEALPWLAQIGEAWRGSRSGRPGARRIRLHECTSTRRFPAPYPDFSVKSEIYRDLHTLAG